MLTSDPAARVLLPVEAGEHDGSKWLDEEEESVREAADCGTSAVFSDDGEVVWVPDDFRDCFIDLASEAGA